MLVKNAVHRTDTPQARVTYIANWPDALGRVVATADYGTNGGTSLSRPATIPARSDTVLLTSMVYDNTGLLQTDERPNGHHDLLHVR